jgi:hypothetical protein
MHIILDFWRTSPVKRTIKLISLILTLLLLAVPAHSSAQAEATPIATAPQGDGEVSGTILNQSPGGEISESMDIMLHAWDANRAEKLMLHGLSNPDGSFSFTDIALEPGSSYAVMADYQGAVYYSDLVAFQGEEDLSDIQVTVYDLTQDLSAVRIEEMHILLNWTQGDLGVTEVYVFSNTGEYTIKDGLSLYDGTPVTLMLPLPEDAWDVRFAGDSGDRFRLYADGFGDTAPLLPGDGRSQIIVSYRLPYEDGMDYAYIAPFDIEALDFYYLQDVGMLVMNDLLQPKGEWKDPSGGKFLIYSHPALKSGKGVELKVFGVPPEAPDTVAYTEIESAETSTGRISNVYIGFGILGGFGLILIGAGVWLWRRSVGEAEMDADSDDSGLTELLAEVIELDEALEHKQIGQEEYFQDRIALHHLIREAIDQWETLHEESVIPSVE